MILNNKNQKILMHDGTYKNIAEILPGDQVIDHIGNIETIDGIYGTPILVGRNCAIINENLEITASHALMGADGNLYAIECPPFWRNTLQQYVIKNYVIEYKQNFSLADNMVNTLTKGQVVYGPNNTLITIDTIETYPNQDSSLVGYDFSTNTTGTIICSGIVLNARKNLNFNHKNWKLHPSDTTIDIIYNIKDNKIEVLYNTDLHTLSYPYLIWNETSKKFVNLEPNEYNESVGSGGVIIVA